MKTKSITKALILGLCLTVGTGIYAQDGEKADDSAESSNSLVEEGKAYFQGDKSFSGGGPSCISCHNVNAEGVMPGGLLAKDLTTLYGTDEEGNPRVGPGFVGFLEGGISSMEAAYGDAFITDGKTDAEIAEIEHEKEALGAFFDSVKDNEPKKAGFGLHWMFGIPGLIILLGLIFVIWKDRKKRGVKDGIFMRQNSAPDAKF